MYVFVQLAVISFNVIYVHACVDNAFDIATYRQVRNVMYVRFAIFRQKSECDVCVCACFRPYPMIWQLSGQSEQYLA